MRRLTLYFHMALLPIMAFMCNEESGKDPDLDCLSGTVLYEISCSGGHDATGKALLIEIRNMNSVDTIATTTLPNAFKIEGQKIFFGLEEASKEIICTLDIDTPWEFYSVINVSKNGCPNQ